MKMYKTILFAFSALLIGCASTKLATADQDREAKRFSSKENTSNIYISRKSETFGKLVPFAVRVDDVDFGTLTPGTYQYVSVGPGNHKIEIKAGINSATIALNAIPMKNYFYSTGAKAGDPIIQPEINLVLLDVMGKLMISQSKRAEVVKP